MAKKKKESSKKEGKAIKDKKTSKKGKKSAELKQEKKKESKKDKVKTKKKEKSVKIKKEKAKKKEVKSKSPAKQNNKIQVIAPKIIASNEAKKSTDFNAKTAISKIRAFKTNASIEKFIEGDVRITVVKVAASKINQFKKIK